MSLMFSAKELAELREEIYGLLPDTAVILRSTLVTESSGAWTETYVPAGTVACRIDPIRSLDTGGVISLQEANKSMYQLTVPFGTDIENGDQVSVNDVVYELIQLHDNHSQRIVTRGIVSEID